MKVLYIIAPAQADGDGKRGVNGPERRSANIINYWQSYSIEPVYAYPSFGTLFEYFNSSRYKMIDFYVKGKFDFVSVFTLVKIIKENDIYIPWTRQVRETWHSAWYMSSPVVDTCSVKYIGTHRNVAPFW